MKLTLLRSFDFGHGIGEEEAILEKAAYKTADMETFDYSHLLLILPPVRLAYFLASF